tara:strand:+ start:1837 stop:2193 length:357 start_codon:yes stop_codon:yes gene_type:complete
MPKRLVPLVAIAGLFSSVAIQSAQARPYLYVDVFEHGGSVQECLDGAEAALIDLGFTEDLGRDRIGEKQGSVSGQMESDSVSAEIYCDQKLGVTSIGVAGLDNDLSYEKYRALFKAEW